MNPAEGVSMPMTRAVLSSRSVRWDAMARPGELTAPRKYSGSAHRRSWQSPGGKPTDECGCMRCPGIGRVAPHNSGG